MTRLFAVVNENGEIQPGGCRTRNGVYSTLAGAKQNLPRTPFYSRSGPLVPGYRVVELKYTLEPLPTTLKVEVPVGAVNGLTTYVEKVGGKLV